MKTTQLSYDEIWHARKTNLPQWVTWRKIMEAGIMAIEVANGIEPPKNLVDEQHPTGQYVIDNSNDVKVEKPKQNVPEKKEEPPKEESQKEDAPKDEEPKNYWMKIEKPSTVLQREFDVLKSYQDQDGNVQREWATVPIDEIDLDSIFRIRDDNSVVVLGEWKRFKKISKITLRDGVKQIMVQPVENKKVQIAPVHS